MIKSKRIQQMKEYVYQHESVSLDELMDHFQVSKNTVRRDVQELVDSGILKKVYGGVSVNHSTLIKFNERKDLYLGKKQLIGQLAATCVEDGDVLFVDSGTTTLEMLPYLAHRHLTIVTNNFDFIHDARAYSGLTLFSTGGMLERNTNSFVGYQSLELLQKYNITKAFLASTGISIANGVTNSSPMETEIKSMVAKKSLSTYLMIDDSKFDQYSLTTYCQLSDLSCIVTNSKPPEAYENYASEHEIRLLYP
ncbi:DeoR/GlpR family DNA-binding transcription regulator [Paenibacillus herberti]|uniref:DNA-binding protein n=1 Tax=Paenibacillus herberti TaxID=1619309 RepID=A0A229P0L2_9BACL|nr:DeoR/GlpR family DNA-binding transcription regulator [Paenibacillus herberti]OXM15419.1 DNA-binding protein [Paenibacillus herberti]